MFWREYLDILAGGNNTVRSFVMCTLLPNISCHNVEEDDIDLICSKHGDEKCKSV
jgi:hypothetical protein